MRLPRVSTPTLLLLAGGAAVAWWLLRPRAGWREPGPTTRLVNDSTPIAWGASSAANLSSGCGCPDPGAIE